MPRVSRTITIRRSVSDVFAFFTDSVNDPTWRRNPPTDLEVIDRQENLSYEFRHSVGAANAHTANGRMSFREVDGHTTVTMTLNSELVGLAQYTQGRKLSRALDAVLGDMDTARSFLEGDAARFEQTDQPES